MWLQKLGHNVSQDQVFNASQLDPSLGRGCYAPDLYKSLQNLGFDPGSSGQIWKRVKPVIGQDLLTPFTEARFRELHADLKAGIPSIICTYYSDRPNTTEHFRLILGYDPQKDEVIYHEPADKNGAYQRMKRSMVLKLWGLADRNGQRMYIRFRLKTKKIQVPRYAQLSNTFTPADYAQHILAIKKDAPLADLTYIVESPFVVVGNERPQTVRVRAEKTVRWATEQFKKDYFIKDPNEIITIWLLKDKQTYATACKAITGHGPPTPYGFFSWTNRAMVMNIATGGGTLVHEMFHSFVPANSPYLPTWINEGMASLYEQSGEQDGKIVGYTNWRLAGLQYEIGKNNLPSFKELTGTTTEEFYGRHSGRNYAHARYLFYYLQQEGKLREFWKKFHTNRKSDPTGYRTLVAVLGEKDMDTFKKDWEKYCMTLKFP